MDKQDGVNELRELVAKLQADTARIDFLEAHPNWLRMHKKHFCCVSPFTNYEYPVFKTAREAIDAAMRGETP